MELNDLRKELIVEEFKDLKQSHANYIKELESTERLVIVAVGALVSWIEAGDIESIIIKAIPSILILFGGLRSYTIGKQMKILNEYMIKIEDYAQFQNEDLGWTKFYETKTRSQLRTKITTIFWFIFLVISIIWLSWP